MNIKRAFDMIDKLQQQSGHTKWTPVSYEGLKCILSELAEPEECERPKFANDKLVQKFKNSLSGINIDGAEIDPRYSYLFINRLVLIAEEHFNNKPDSIREVYEKYNKPGVMIDTIHGLSEIWEAVCKHCETNQK